MPSGLPFPGKLQFGVIGWIVLFFASCSYSNQSYSNENYSNEVINFHLHSTAVYETSGVPSYTAGLYLDEQHEGISSEFAFEHANAMAFKIIRSRVSSRSWGKELVQRAVINNSPEVISARANAFKQFSALLSEWLYKGDLVEIRRQFDGATVHVNNVELDYIKDSGLFSAFLGVWIGPVPPSTEFKQNLLSTVPTEDQMSEFFAQPNYPDREARAKSWLTILSPAKEVLPKLVEHVPQPVEVAASGAKENTEIDSTSELEIERQRLAEKEEALLALQAQMEAENKKREEREALARVKQEQDALLGEYTKRLFRHPNQYIRYPLRSQARREQGLVEVTVQINRVGDVVEALLETSSDFPRLDKAAIEAVEDASPFPGVPDQIPGDVFEFVVPLTFRMQ